jgi:hypothetical protein
MMRDYTIVFIEPVDLDALADAASDAFAIPREQIEVWDGDEFAAPVVEPVIAQVAGAGGPGCFAEFVGFHPFAAHTGSPEPLEVASALATRVKRRAIFGPDSAEDYHWTLVAADGSHGTAVLDSNQLDEGAFSILGTIEPIAGAPDLPRLDSGIATVRPDTGPGTA